MKNTNNKQVKMNKEQKELLNRMIKENNTVDNTENIRKNKISDKIREDVYTIQKMKQSVKPEEEKHMIEWYKKNCSYLYENYKTIFERLLNNEMDVKLLFTFLDCLKRVEDGELEQQEASFEIGKILKQLYVDPKIKDEKQEYTKGKPVSWSDFKKSNA
jgi:hypothetical protein